MSAELAENEVNLKTAEKLGLNEEEFGKIIEILGRTPNFTELSVFSVFMIRSLLKLWFRLISQRDTKK